MSLSGGCTGQGHSCALKSIAPAAWKLAVASGAWLVRAKAEDFLSPPPTRYDLFKLFRTSGEMSQLALRDFLRCYARCMGAPGSRARSARADAISAIELDELLAETYAAEPLTWLEAAVFFLFACAEYPEETERWAPLARQRWERYLASAHIVDVGGEATLALARSRAASQALRI